MSASSFLLRGAPHFHAGRVVVARGVEGPDVNRDEGRDHEREQIMQREEPVEGRVVHRGSTQEPGLQALADPGDRAEETGDHRGTPEGHLAPGQHVAHEGGRHHQQEDQHADDPRDLARRLVGAVIETAEDVQIDRDEEQRRPVGVHVPEGPAAVHVAHDVLDRAERHVDMRRVMHREDDAGDDLQHEAERQHDAPDPHPVQVAGGRDRQGRVHQADDRQAFLDPFLAA